MKAHDSLRSAHEEMQKNLVLFDATVAKYERLFQTLEALGEQVSVDFELSSGWINVRASGQVLLLRQVWKALRASGFNTDYRPKEANKQTMITSVWYPYKLNEKGERQRDFDTKIFLNFSSTVCKRVAIGTRKVEKEETIYEIVCE
jgi:hypothetical protein